MVVFVVYRKMNFDHWFKQKHPTIPTKSVQSVLALTADGATLPFIARYRKEQTGNQDEVAIQHIIDGKEQWDQIEKRQAFILEAIQKQDKLTAELKTKISACFELSELESLYLPYKLKRKTKAMVAKEAGLEPLAIWVWQVGQGDAVTLASNFDGRVKEYINADKGLKDSEEVLAGLQHILTEKISDMSDLRSFAKKILFSTGTLKTKKTKTAAANSKYEMYFEYQEPIQSLLKPNNSHRYLAIRRGWLAKELSLSFGTVADQPDHEERLIEHFQRVACAKSKDSPEGKLLLESARLACKVSVLPSCQKEAHKELKTLADGAAIGVFGANVKQLLLAAPFGAKAVMGIDPGIRTGCKVAIVDDAGAYKEDAVIYPGQDSKRVMAGKVVLAYCQKYNLKAIAIGNGTAGRETESFVRAVIKEAGLQIPVVMVNEAGASVYSASAAAREEFPDLDLTVRGAISIARRLQDPLAELVKIDPKSIGVGQYQHDVAPTQLMKGLGQVVEICVNSVGVNLNTASYHLLSHVSGIGASLAKNIVLYRNKKGLFGGKKDLLSVSRFSEKAFEQAAGFLRVPTSKNPLDNTGVHPERYPVLEGLAKELGKKVSELVGEGAALVKQSTSLKQELGDYTFNDIVFELEKPGRDSREEFTAFSFREDINSLSDLKENMVCPGIVTNVTNFGAFVDIGVHQDGLVHISRLANKFVKDPNDVVKPGDRVKVKVIKIDAQKNQIGLSMRIDDEPEKTGARPKGGPVKPIKRSGSGFQNKPKKSFSNNPFAVLGQKGKS